MLTGAIRIAGGVIAAFGMIIAYSLRNLVGNEGPIAILIGLLLVAVGVGIVVTHPRTKPPDQNPSDMSESK